jgi:hypothetical protein
LERRIVNSVLVLCEAPLLYYLDGLTTLIGPHIFLISSIVVLESGVVCLLKDIQGKFSKPVGKTFWCAKENVFRDYRVTWSDSW